MDARTEFEPQS